MRLRIGLIILLFCWTERTLAQQDLTRDYVPQWNFFPSDSSILHLQRKFMLWVSRAQIDNRSAKAQFARHMIAKAGFIRTLDSLGLLMASDPMTGLLNQIAAQIVSQNPSLDGRQFQILTLRSSVSNAYSVGEGVILVSTSLLSQVTSLDQLAFVLAHEMSHEVQTHVFRHAVSYCEGLFDGDLKKEIRQARRNPVSRKSVVRDIVYGYLAEHMEYSREMELEADSLGYTYARNAGFDPHHAEQFFRAAHDVSGLSYTDTAHIMDAFDFDDLPFQQRWLVDTDHAISWVPDSTVMYGPDSLSTHPETEARLERLIRFSLHPNIHGDGSGPNSLRRIFNTDRKTTPFELVAGLIQVGDFAEALYVILDLRKQYPVNVFLHCALIHCLTEIRQNLMQGIFLEVVDFPQMTYSDGYNRLLTFLHHMNSDLLEKISSLYEQKYLSNRQDHPYVLLLQQLKRRTDSARQEMQDHVVSGQQDSFYAFILDRHNTIIQSRQDP
jgi:Zn-dependent protease with chaperone function